MEINFKKLNENQDIAEIISNITPSAKNSRLSSEADSIIKLNLNASEKSHQIRGFCIKYYGNKTSENSAQQAFVDLAKFMCQSDEYYTRLKNKKWFYSKEEIASVKSITKRYGNVRDDYYIFKDCEVTLLMAKAIKLVIDCNESELDNFSFIYDVRETENSEGNINWWPSIEEYKPNIKKNDWLKILNNQNIIDSGYGEFLAMFYTEPEGAACSAIAEKFSIKSPTSIISKCTHLAKRIHQSTNCPLVENVENAKYWPVLFLGKDNKTDGTYIWKLRPELYDALTEFGIEKYLPHQTGIFDSWEIIDENTAVKTCDKSFFEHNGSGVPKGICWYFNADDCNPGDRIDIEMEYAGNKYNARVSNESSDRRRVRIFWNSELGEKFKEKQNIEGIKLKFTRQGTDKYSVDFIHEKEISRMSTKDNISIIVDYITNQGFSYPGKLVENFYLSLKSKPFVILAGTSGTGKTRLVRLFAEAINAEYKLVPVRPDWSDSSDLFGHVNLNDKFVSGAIIDFIKAANDNPSKPYILCLDEMNLARVEYYLSDFLSIIETRDMRDGIIVTDPLISVDKYGIDTDAIDKYGELSFPENLYVVGTVNMDETTFPFSKKVLDRANTIEFNYVDLMPSFSNNEEGEKISVDNSFLRSQYLKLAECTGEDEFIKTACTELQNINLILQTANLHIGYRVRDEIVFYLLNNKNSENLITYNDAFDNQLLQKILPRVQGSSESIRKMLCELFKHIAGDFELANGNSDSERMQKIIDDNKCKYPKSAAKIQMMISRFEDDGFTSYWL